MTSRTDQAPQAELLRVVGLSTELAGPDGWIQAIDDVSFSLRQGETLGIVGESGCGKTVTALSIMGLLPRRTSRVSGHVYYAGRDLAQMPEREMRLLRGAEIAMIFQDPMTSLNPVISVGAQLRDVLRLHKDLDKRAAERRAVELLEMVEIPDARRRVHDYQHQFSGGMRQRVMIAMALSAEPKLLIADEATTALDVTTQAQILDLLRSLTTEIGTAIIFISHDFGVVASMCDRINVMYAGRIVESAPVAQLLGSSRMPYTWGLLESLPQAASGSTNNRILPSIEGSPPQLSQHPAFCTFSPRCRYVRDRCKTAEPPLAERTALHLARCWGTDGDGWIDAR